ncbi:hypothetical protein Bpfe_029701 [Biomphalaria pfeifferi]|uniref:Uncharacterized protein n=1 Tax=Biomphalaria pfeifferi TaxID=112525 RepID=A0AAD8AR65_BIOPF|nr:hypothetical protein Bpfe_029701 [Biomphalaria pfeifferi]
MELRKETKNLWKAITLLQLLGFALTLTGYSTNYIISSSDKSSYAGIWTACIQDDCRYIDNYMERVEGSKDWLHASRALMTICFVCQFFTILLTTIALRWKPTKFMSWITSKLAIWSVLVGITGVAVAVSKGIGVMEGRFHGSFGLDWSFILFITGQCLFFVAYIGHHLD